MVEVSTVVLLLIISYLFITILYFTKEILHKEEYDEVDEYIFHIKSEHPDLWKKINKEDVDNEKD